MPFFVKQFIVPALALGLLGALPTLSHADTSHYAEFGGKPGMNAVTKDFLGYVLADDRIKAYFTNANIPVLQASLSTQFCMLEGGGCEFDENMKTIHQNLGVTQAAFNALAEDLQKSMMQHKVPLTAQNDLLAKLAPMEHDIVTK